MSMDDNLNLSNASGQNLQILTLIASYNNTRLPWKLSPPNQCEYTASISEDVK